MQWRSPPSGCLRERTEGWWLCFAGKRFRQWEEWGSWYLELWILNLLNCPLYVLGWGLPFPETGRQVNELQTATYYEEQKMHARLQVYSEDNKTRQGHAGHSQLFAVHHHSSNNIEMISVSEKYRISTLVTTDTSNSDIRSMPGPEVGSKLIRDNFCLYY